MLLRRNVRLIKKLLRTQLLMQMVSTSKLLLKLRKKPHNFKLCWLPVKLLLNKRFKMNKKNLPDNLLLQLNQLSKKKMMVTLKLLKKLKQRWLLPKLQWTKVYKKLIIE